MKETIKNQAGFTWIEMTLVIVVLAILVGMSFAFLTGGIGTYITGRDYTNISQEGKIALERMAREVRFAIQSTVTIGTNSISFTKYTGSPNDAGTDIIFHVVSGTDTLRRTSDGADTRDLAANVQNFSPSFDTIYFLVTLDLTLARGEGSVRYRTTVHPRN